MIVLRTNHGRQRIHILLPVPPGTCFLMGMQKQMRVMFAKTRRVAAIVFVVTMALTLFFALFRPDCDDCIPDRVLCILVCIGCQLLVLFW